MGNHSSKVSIVIPTYNHGHLIDRCLHSILNQTYKNLEVIVVDNHSIDNTKKVIQAYQTKITIQYLLIENNGIIAKSRNLGIQNSTGDYIAFLDSDDWWLPEKLERSIEYLEKGADLVYHDLWLYITNGIPRFFNKAKSRVVRYPIFKDLLINGNAIINSSVVVRKSVLNQIGLLSEDKNLIAWEDYEYWLRISKITNQFVRIPDCLGFYWVGGGNISNPDRTIRINESIKNTYKNDFIDYYGKSNQYPEWIEYSNLSAGLDLGQINLFQILKSFNKLNTKSLILVFFKWFFEEN